MDPTFGMMSPRDCYVAGNAPANELQIFFGCPHRCTSTQDMEDKVANLLFVDKIPRPIGATRIIKEMGRSIIDINGSFAVSNTLSLPTIINVYSDAEDAALQMS